MKVGGDVGKKDGKAFEENGSRPGKEERNNESLSPSRAFAQRRRVFGSKSTFE